MNSITYIQKIEIQNWTNYCKIIKTYIKLCRCFKNNLVFYQT